VLIHAVAANSAAELVVDPALAHSRQGGMRDRGFALAQAELQIGIETAQAETVEGNLENLDIFLKQDNLLMMHGTPQTKKVSLILQELFFGPSSLCLTCIGAVAIVRLTSTGVVLVLGLGPLVCGLRWWFNL